MGSWGCSFPESSPWWDFQWCSCFWITLILWVPSPLLLWVPLIHAPVSTLTRAPVSTLTHVPPWSTNKLMLHQTQRGCNSSFTWLLVSCLEWTDICLCFPKKIYVTGILKRYLQSHIHCIINYDIQKPKQCSMATWIKKYAIFMHGGLLSSLRRHCHLQRYGWSWRTLWCVN